jgi:hypothetical protein
VLIIVLVFGSGYFLGSVDRSPADAQLQDIAEQATDAMKGSGGALGQAAELGEAIVEMQQHVDGLQENLDTLRTVQDALGM